MRKLFKKDSFFATLFVFAIIGILYLNPINSHLVNPLNVSLTDFSFNDLAFSQSHLSNTKDERIVIVNIDTIGRATIAKVIKHLSAYQPKVMGVDITFSKKDDVGNRELDSAIQSIPQLVLAQSIAIPANIEKQERDNVHMNVNQFAHDQAKLGYVNFTAEESGVVRYYAPIINSKHKLYESFTTAIIKMVDSSAYNKIYKRNKTNEWINYKRSESNYYQVMYSDILSNQIDSTFLKDKIILLGFVSNNQNNIEDKHFTPINSKLFGRSLPDMNGVIIHANIISMILDDDYIYRVPTWILFLVSFFITCLYMSFLMHFYIHKHIWFHIVAKTIELILGVTLVYVSILMLRYFSISIDFTLMLVLIVLSIDALYFYEGLLNWLERKFSISSIFTKNHH